MRRFFLSMLMVPLLAGVASADVTVDTSSPSLAITDNGYDGTLGGFVTDTINVTGHTLGNTITDVRLDIDINHTWIGDLTVMLSSPDSIIVGVVSRPGLSETGATGECCGGDQNWAGSESFGDLGSISAENMHLNLGNGFVFTPFADSTASVFGALSAFSGFAGGNPNGAWTIWVSDGAGADIGTLNSWTLTVVSAVPEPTSFLLIGGIAGLGLVRRRR